MGLIEMAMIVSIVLIVAVYYISGSSWGMGGVCLLTASTTVMFLCLFSPPVALQSLLTFSAALACIFFRCGRRVMLPAAIAAMVVSYALHFHIVAGELDELAELRAQCPIVPLTDRLAYETEQPRRVSAASPIPLGAAVQQVLRDMELHGQKSYRSEALKRLHEHTTDQFVMAQGFGAVRMTGVYVRGIELPQAQRIPQPEDPEYSPDKLSEAARRVEPILVPSDTALTAAHRAGIEDFLEPERMGYVRDKEHVAGFLAHQFRAIPRVDPASRRGADWRIVRLELISLLKHEVPVAYVSKNLPSMDELRDAPTRPLDALEQSALERLRTEEDLVIEENENRIRMVGSLRAAEDCLACHSVRRGELLGAFSYQLTPANVKPLERPPARAAKPDETRLRHPGRVKTS